MPPPSPRATTHSIRQAGTTDPIAPSPRGRAARPPLGEVLVGQGVLDPGDLAKALAIRRRQAVRLGDILVSHGMVSAEELVTGLSQQYGAAPADLTRVPPDVRLVDRLGAATCLREGLIPVRQFGGTTVVASARPDEFERHRPMLTRLFGRVLMALCSEVELHAALLRLRGADLTRRAESRLPDSESCRSWDTRPVRRAAVSGLAVAFALALVAPLVLFSILMAWALVTLLMVVSLRVVAAFAWARAQRLDAAEARAASAAPPPEIARLPAVALMVPLYRETDIAPRLIRRLGRLTYPKELLDVMLIVEAEDTQTMQALASVELPSWMRIIPVPRGSVKTKPRALNYALDFARGSIVGIYDAEDAPEPDQIHRVVRRFHDRGAELACVQGILDYYNPATNWISRCFTIEYAAWFRVVLRGMERLGFALPLGGTTLFVRRDVLERVGAWDAHNVTEDADLGIRLARHGYRTEIVSTTTDEEPNCHVVPWIKQRSRWLKGFLICYAVLLRTPRKTLRELGWWRFWGVNVVFMATVSQYLLAPLLWSFWLLFFGLWHPFAGVAPAGILLAMGVVFLLAEAVNMSIAMIAVRGRKHRFLSIWVPMLHVYFPMGCFAAYKAVWELLWRPFYWDKTAHGIHDQAGAASETANAADTGASGAGMQGQALSESSRSRVSNALEM